ncbi:MAG: hypothetical protein A2020_02870 [Lentisphaerae bacterium GWF2_45_14]|nr:MAG: hypothetical protein A2020_02870 [Lentisphaerae bacterium GWF2_45_14]
MMIKENLKSTVYDLSEKIGCRPPGSWKELEAAQYLKGRLAEFGVEGLIESFPSASHLAEKSVISVCGKTFDSMPSQFSAPGNISGNIFFLGHENNKTFSQEENLSGKIGLLMPSASLSIPEKIDYLLALESQGIEALIVVSPYMDTIQPKSVRYPEIKSLPIAVVSWRTGVELARLNGHNARLEVIHEDKKRSESVNLTVGIAGKSKKWITVSAHMDSAAGCPGALDNAGGSAMLLELVRHFKGMDLRNTVYFVFTGSEEYGMQDMCGAGSEAFYRSREGDIENCVAHIEIDDIGNFLGMPEIDWAGPDAFLKKVRMAAENTSYLFNRKNLPSCDHGAAIKRGIPYMWLTDALFERPVYHSPEDNIDFFDFEKAASYFQFLSKAVESLASSEIFYPYVREGNLLIRPARFSDLSSIFEINKQAFGPVSMARMAEDFFGEKLGDKNWYDYKGADVANQCRSNIYQIIVCEVATRVVAYATASYDFAKGIAEIGNNAVDPDFQGRGIGKAMQKEIARRMDEEGFTKLKVSTLSVDIPAQKIYEKLGYVKYCENINYLKKLEK